MSIYKKLLNIQQKINGLSKDTKSNTYQYVSGSKVLENIKPMMNELGLLLKQEVLSIQNTRQDYKTGIGTNYEKPKSEILSKVMMRFTWIDCETGEKDENLFGANGQNDWEKGLGSALTYAERYFLLKYFHIATDEDDIDNENRKKDNTEQTKPIEQAINPFWVTEIEKCTTIEILESFYKANEAEIKKQKNVLILIKSQKEKLLKDGN
jgi:hypothetical protein